MNIGFVSLGCSKNLVDTEMMIGLFKNNGYNVVNNPKEADIILINTCGFIETAKEEAINTILEMAEYKKKRCKYVIVTGCLVQRYKDELQKAIPEVDLFVACESYEEFWTLVSSKIPKIVVDNKYNKLDYLNRVITTGDKMAYLKIAEGCSNRCTYCAIPYIRGPFVSRKMEDILKEAQNLAQNGIKELIVIAQDTTKYGVDIYGKPCLSELLSKLCQIEQIQWIRFLYAYPETITEELIQVVKNNDKICNYFDIPIQHISNKVLKRMNRKSDSNSIKALMDNIRKEIPDVILRTTVIVGFPGETQEDFTQLYEFIKQTKFNKLGAFMYSKEDGTPAEKLPMQIHQATKKSRYNKIMSMQKQISKDILNSKIGKEYNVLIEAKSFDGKYYIGRTYMDVPDMDGVIFVKNDGDNDLIGNFIKCKVEDVKEYDLIGKVVRCE